MKISIDTSADSKEEIRKAIKLLLSIVEQDSAQRDIFAASSPEVYSAPTTAAPEPSQSSVSAFGSMFGDDAPKPEVEVPKEKKDPKVELY